MSLNKKPVNKWFLILILQHRCSSLPETVYLLPPLQNHLLLVIVCGG